MNSPIRTVAARWRHTLAAATTVGLLATGLAVVPTAASALPGCTEYWAADGLWSGAPAPGGTGTAGDPYLVGDRSDLEMVANCTSNSFRQIADITLNSPLTTLGDFTGAYDGADHAITGLTTTPGLFTTITGSATVTSLQLSAVEITGAATIGALAGAVEGPVQVSHISASGSVTGDAGSGEVGGIIGGAAGDPEFGDPKLSHLAWSGTVAGSEGIGGIIGVQRGGSISASEVSGSVTSITGVDSIGLAVGGVVGIVEGVAMSDVRARNVAITGSLYVGGIVGALFDGSSLTRAEASGSVTGGGGFNALIGGIAGVIVESPTSSVSVRDMSVSAMLAAGGITGGVLTTTLRDASSAAAVSAAATDEITYAGGIAAITDEATISDVVSTGPVTGAIATGGAIGSAEFSDVSAATASGAVTGSDFTGGLIGALTQSTVSRTSATGAVSGTRAVGGLVGGMNAAAGTVSDSAASGAVTAAATAGGLIGEMSGTVTRSSASGAVTTTEDAAGGLIGVLLPVGYICAGDQAQVCSAADQPTATRVSESFATGKTTGRQNVGGLVGQLPGALCVDLLVQFGDCVLPGADNAVDVIDTYATGNVQAAAAAGGLIGSTADYTPPIVTSTDSAALAAPSDLEGPRLAPLRTVLASSRELAAARTAGGDTAATAAAIPAGVTSSYASGVVSAAADAGGLLGKDTGTVTVTQSFWDSTANPGLSGGAGTAKTQTQLRDIGTFGDAGWKIQVGAPGSGSNVWGICSPPDPTVGQGYPYLLWQHPTSDPCDAVPAAPTLDSVTSRDRALAVSATLGGDGGSPITGVQYRLDGGTWTDSGGVSGSFTITGLTNGTRYRVQVRALNIIGPSPASNTRSGTPRGVTTLQLNKRAKKTITPDQRTVLVRSARSNGRILRARVICTLNGTQLPPRLRDRFCDPRVNRAGATGGEAAAKTRKKQLRVTVRPTCSVGLRATVTVTAKATGSLRKTRTQTYRVADRPRTKCRIKGTG